MIQYAQPNTQEIVKQIPLFNISFDYQQPLESLKDNAWYNFINEFNWMKYRNFACEYYRALHQFNKSFQQTRRFNEKCDTYEPGLFEDRKQAQQRLLFQRATMDSSQPKLFNTIPCIKPDSDDAFYIDEDQLSPWCVPSGFGGRKPKCFFALLKSFLATIVMGRPGTVEEVYTNLINNPAFV